MVKSELVLAIRRALLRGFSGIHLRQRGKAGICCRWLSQIPLLFPVCGCVCELYACLIFTRGSIPFNFIFTPKAQVLREHGVLTLPRLSAVERRLYIVTYSFQSTFLHLLPGNIAIWAHEDALVPASSSVFYYRRENLLSSVEFGPGECPEAVGSTE